jgi:hypothetical protein
MTGTRQAIAAGILAVGGLAGPWWAGDGPDGPQPVRTAPSASTHSAPRLGPVRAAGGPLELPRDMPQLAGAARTVRARYGVPVSVTLAQALHESGNGRSQLATRYGNLFGIKCRGRSADGSTATGCVTLATEECRPSCILTRQPFRRYQDWRASVLDYGHLLATVPAYRPAFAHRGDPVAFARAVAAAGYATDPAYAAKLAVRVAALRRYDR